MRLQRMARLLSKVGMLAVAMPLVFGRACAQQPASTQEGVSASTLSGSVRELQAQIRELRTLLIQMRAEIDSAHAANLEVAERLRETQERLEIVGRDFQSLRQAESQTGSGALPQSAPAGGTVTETVEERVVKLEEDQQLLGGKIEEQYQTKIESASKYRVRVSGIALLNLFDNRGRVDNMDFPAVAERRSPLDTSGTIGATMRQSQVGLEVFGPQINGARLSGDLEMDFSGGFPDTPNGVNAGLFRLRTATLRLDWPHTSIVAGQDPLFISPLSPTSLASLATPALSYAGNLWAWTPQVRIEHRLDLSENSSLLLQGGLLDPLTGELPQDEYLRFPHAGEKSRQPAYGTRFAWSHRAFGKTLTLGAGGYYSRQSWGFNRNVDAWAGMTDWSVPITRWLQLDGEFFRGRGIGGLGAGFGRSVLSSGSLSDSSASVRGLDAIGGWAQSKIKPSAKYEFNAAFGQDSSRSSEVRRFPTGQAFYDPSLVRNRSWLGNFLYQPRSDLLFSVEYRRLQTFSFNGASDHAHQVNLAMGVLF